MKPETASTGVRVGVCQSSRLTHIGEQSVRGGPLSDQRLHLFLLLLLLTLLVQEVLQEERLFLKKQWPTFVLGLVLGEAGLVLALGGCPWVERLGRGV